MEIVMRNIDELKPYEKNPRKNDKAVEKVADSIKQFGFRNPILINDDGEIIAGHTRLKAAKLLGIEQVPVIMVEDLSPEQVKAFRIMDNRSAEFADWDFELLKDEFADLKGLDFDLDFTGFDEKAREVIGFESELEDVPDVDTEGVVIDLKDVIIIQFKNTAHASKIREFFNIPAGRKSVKSEDVIELLKKKQLI